MNADPALVAAILRSDLHSFIQATFPIVSPNDEFAANWHIEAIAFHLDLVRQGRLKRLIITLPPRSLKSICASVAFPAFVLGHNPRQPIICVSYSEALARKHANDCRAVMRSDLYRVSSQTRASVLSKTPNLNLQPRSVVIVWPPRWAGHSPAEAATSSSLMIRRSLKTPTPKPSAFSTSNGIPTHW